jgi:hypothetical protein
MAIPEKEKNDIWLEVEQKSPELLKVFLVKMLFTVLT